MKTCRSSISSVFVPNWRTFILQLRLHILLFAGDSRGGGSDNHMARSAVWRERTDAVRAYVGFHYDRQTACLYDYYTGISSRKRRLRNNVKNDNRCCRIMSTRVARPLPVCQLCDCVKSKFHWDQFLVTSSQQMLRGSYELVTDLLRGSRACRACRQLVTRKLTTSRGSYEELVPVEFGLNYTNAWVITLPTIRVITRVSTILANKDDQYWWWWW